MQALRAYLSGISTGPIHNVKEVEELLASSWEEFAEDDSDMKPKKPWVAWKWLTRILPWRNASGGVAEPSPTNVQYR
jgi:hypothetical protein